MKREEFGIRHNECCGYNFPIRILLMLLKERAGFSNKTIQENLALKVLY